MPLEFLASYFLNPVGLLALLGLVPLIAFYLIRPKPEERVMPSMRFFAEQQKSGRVRQALEQVMKNLLLLLHILMILGIAAALAQLYTTGKEKPDKSVIVLDRSASMSNDLEQAKSFARSNLGEQNTLIVVGEEIEVPVEKASAARARQELRKVETRDVRTDIAGALELASDYQGTISVASDLDQTVSERSVNDLLQNLAVERDLRIMETDNANSWGIIRVDPGKQNSSVDIKNFRSQAQEINVNVNGDTRTVSVDGGEVSTVTFSSSRLNRVELEDDELEADNSAFISVPREKNFEVLFISDEGNRYFEKAVELIDFTSIRTARPPLDRDPEADVYVIGQTNRLLKARAEEISREVKEGSSLVVFGQDNMENFGQFLPSTTGRRNASVEIVKPRRINVGRTLVYDLENKKGEALSSPGDALRRSDHGRGEVVVYNLRDRDFHFDFLYPVFWKEMFQQLVDRSTVEELNIRTGEDINESRIETPSRKASGLVTARETGFYNSSDGVYAANLASEDESNTETPELDLAVDKTGKSEKNLQHFAALVLAALALLELLYLGHIGDV